MTLPARLLYPGGRRMRPLSLLIALSAVVVAQMDPREIVARSVANEDRSWQARQNYTYSERDEEKHLDSRGRVKSDEVEVSRIIFVHGSPLEQTVSHNGGPPTASQRRKDQEALQKRRNETPAERAARLRKDRENLTFLDEVPRGFDFRMIGEEPVNGRPAYVLRATPKPGYHSHAKYTKMFAKAQGKLWVDKQDLGWVKVDATVTEPFSVGLFLARVLPGSHILFEQTRVGDGLWMPKLVEVRAEARVLFLVTYRTDETITFSDYRPAQAPQALQPRTDPAAKYRLGSSQ